MASPSSRPVGLTICVGIVALVAGLAGGFVGGHLKGKTDSTAAVKDAKAAEETAAGQASSLEKSKVDLAAKLVDANGRLAETRKLLGERTDNLIAANREIERLKKATAATAAQNPAITAPVNFEEAIERVKNVAKKMSEEEPAISEKVTKGLAQSEVGARLLYESLKSDTGPLNHPGMRNQLESAGYTYAVQLFILKMAIQEEQTIGLFKKVWKSKWSTSTLAERMIYFRSIDPATRALVSEAILQVQRPLNAEIKSAINIITAE